MQMCFWSFCRLRQHLEQMSAGSVTTFPCWFPGCEESSPEGRKPPVPLSTPSFLVRLAIVMGTQCCYWATVGRSLLIGWKHLKCKHVGNNQSSPADAAFNILKNKKNPTFFLSVNYQTCSADVSSSPKHKKKGRNEKSQRTFLHAFTSSDLFSLAARPAPVPPD